MNVTTALPHTFAADLDVTVTSPAGTVVTLTSDNGGSADNVFDGTVWDDSANPAGQVPYTLNDGLVTDHGYLNLVLASPLVPEEALGAFIGEDPNGTWTITISDDNGGDSGTLTSWSLSLTTFAGAPAVSAPATFEQTTPTPIADAAVATSTLDVSGLTAPVCNAILRTTLPHTFAGDIDMTLTSPAGTVVTVTSDNGGPNDNVFAGTVWNVTANPAGQVPYNANDGLVTDNLYVNLVTATPLVPEESMSAFLGEAGNGTWTITVSDDTAGDSGSLDAWSLELQTCSCQLADLSVTVIDTPDPVPVGDEVSYAITLANAGPDPAVGLTFDTATPADTTFVSLVAAPELTCVTPVVGGTGAIGCTSATPLAAAGDYALTLVVAVDDGVADGTVLTLASSVASSTGDADPADNVVDTTTTVTAQADLAVTLLDAPDPVPAGDTIAYTATATNAGPADAVDVEIALPLPAGTTFVAATPSVGGLCTTPAVGANGTVSCSWAGVTDTATPRSIDIDASVDAGVAAGTVLSATATVSAASPDVNAANDEATADTTVVAAQADLAITKDDGSTSATPGGTTTYTIVASNLGPADVVGATVTDTPPAALTCSWTATFAGGATGAASGGADIAETIDLPAGAAATYTLDCSIDAGASGSLANTASIAAPAEIADPVAGNNTATDTDALDGEADLSVISTVAPPTAGPGDSVTFTVVVQNAGPSGVTDAQFTDDLPAEATCTWTAAFAGGASGTAAGSGDIAQTLVLPSAATATYTIACDIAADAPAGTISDAAAVSSAATSDPLPGNNDDSADVTISGGAIVSGSKSVSTPDGVAPGATISYVIVLGNSGTRTQADNAGDEFVDVLPAGLTGLAVSATSGTVVLNAGTGTVTWNGAIAPGADVTITIDASIDADATGTIANQATLHYDADGNDSNDAVADTDDPATPAADDPTAFEVDAGTVAPPAALPAVIPTTGTLGLVALALLLLGLGWRRRAG